MRNLILIAVLSLAACAIGQDDPNIHASDFIYDKNVPQIVTKGQFVYDKDAPVLHASQFLINGKK